MYRATMKPYCVNGVTYCPTPVRTGEKFYGTASWYGPKFHGEQTSNGEYYNMYDYTAAHKTLPINTMVKVTNLSNGKSTIVRINDRGPFVKNRIIDLSYQAAQDIGVVKHGTAKVELEVLSYDATANRYAHKKAVSKKPVTTQKAVAISKTLTSTKTEPTSPTKVSNNIKRDPLYHIQIASFSNKDKALAFKRKCYNIIHEHQIRIKTKKVSNQPIYTILISGFKSAEDAKAYMKRYGYKDAFVVRD
jgi:rare lipoprotein A